MKKLWTVIFAAMILLSACSTEAGGQNANDVSGMPEEDVLPIAGGIETGFPNVDTGFEIPEDSGVESVTEYDAEDMAENKDSSVAETANEPDPDAPGFNISKEAAEIQEYRESDEVKMTIDKKFREAIVIKMENLTGEAVDRGSSFRVEVKVDGKWHRLEHSQELQFPMCNVWIDPDSTDYDIIALSDIYGILPDGEYRICKYFNKESDFDNPIYLAAEFSLGEDDTTGKPGVPDDGYGYILGRENEASTVAQGLELTVKEGEDRDNDSGGIKLILKNNSDTDAEYGENFRLLTLVGNKWYYVREVVDNRPMSAVLLTTTAGSESELDWINWAPFYGDLPQGEYGVEIQVNVGGEQKYVFCPFVLWTPTNNPC